MLAWVDLDAGVDESWAMLQNSAFADTEAARDLLAIREAVPGVTLQFDPLLVRGMGYYTGPIFEVAHPDLGYSLGGGGRYDGMIGRFLGTDVAATGFSLGFERLIDLVDLGDDPDANASALFYDADAALTTVMALQSQLVSEGARVRLVKRPKNMKAALEQLAGEGFTRFATVSGSSQADATALDWRRLEPAS
jgi:histidyl-tRNA synthetase